MILQQWEAKITPSRTFSFCWNQIVLSKVGCFAWISLRKRALTSDRISKFHISQSFNYHLCDQELEDGDHLFLNCPFAQQYWYFILDKLHYFTPLPNKLWNLFQSWSELYSNSFFSKLWTCILNLIIWALWWEHNKTIFRQHPSTIDSILITIEKYISKG